MSTNNEQKQAFAIETVPLPANGVRYTIAEAAAHPQLSEMAMSDLELDLPINELQRRFDWAVGVDVETCEEDVLDASEIDVVADPCIVVALHGTPDEFAAWLAQDDYSQFELTSITGGSAWADAALARCRGVTAWPAAWPACPAGFAWTTVH